MLPSPIRSLLSIASLALIPGVLSAQYDPWVGPPMPLNETNWAAVLKPNPGSSGSTAKGRAWFTLDSETKLLRYRIETNVSNATVAHLKSGYLYDPPYSYGGTPYATLSGSGGTFQGSIGPISSSLWKLLSRGPSSAGWVVVDVCLPDSPTVSIAYGTVKLDTRRHARATFADDTQIESADFEVHQPEGYVTYRIPSLGPLQWQLGAAIYDTSNGEPGTVVATIPAGTRVGAFTAGVLDPNKLIFGYYDLAITLFNGTVRSPIVLRYEYFIARATGGQAYPPSGSPCTGLGKFTYDPATRRITYLVNWNLPGALAEATIKTLYGDVVETLANLGPTSGSWAGVSAPLTVNEEFELFAGRLYVTISLYSTTAFDVRGRIEQNGRPFGWPSVTSAFSEPHELRISQASVPTVGANWTVRLTGGLPNSIVWLYVGDDTNFYAYGNGGGVLWILYDNYYMAATDSDGAAEVTILVPSTPALKGTPVFTQWVATESGAPYPGYVFSDALYSVYQ